LTVLDFVLELGVAHWLMAVWSPWALLMQFTRSLPPLPKNSEQVGAGAQHASDPVERVTGSASVSAGGLLEALTAAVQGVAGQRDDVEGVHHRDRVRQLFGGGGLEAGEED
jgi:hypothetical protein